MKPKLSHSSLFRREERGRTEVNLGGDADVSAEHDGIGADLQGEKHGGVGAGACVERRWERSAKRLPQMR
jgi:hypothetical protein